MNHEPLLPQARDAITALKSNVDTLIVIPNDRLLTAVDPNLPLSDAFKVRGAGKRAAGAP